jgi:hypothetical protein
LSAAGEWSREDLASQDRCTGAAHPCKRGQQFSLPPDCGILRIGGIAFLLDNAKLGLDQRKTLVFPFKFTTQAFGKRPALDGGQLAKSNRVRRRFGSIPQMPWAKSSPLMPLIWPVRSRTRRWRSRWERRASSSSTVATRTTAHTWRSSRSIAMRARSRASESIRSVFENAGTGFRCGYLGYGSAETSMLRDQFLNDSVIGVALWNFNALKLFIRYSLFQNNGVGAGNYAVAGNGDHAS